MNQLKKLVPDIVDQQDTSRSLAGIQSGICSLGYDQLAQMNGVNTNIANGFAGVNSAICQLGYLYLRKNLLTSPLYR